MHKETARLLPRRAMIQGYHAYSLPRSHNWSVGTFSLLGLFCVVCFGLFVCVFFVWLCFVVHFFFVTEL